MAHRSPKRQPSGAGILGPDCLGSNPGRGHSSHQNVTRYFTARCLSFISKRSRVIVAPVLSSQRDVTSRGCKVLPGVAGPRESVAAGSLTDMRDPPPLLISVLTLRITAQLDGGNYRLCFAIFLEAATVSSWQTNLLLSSWQSQDLAEKERRVLRSSHGRAESWETGHLRETTATQAATTPWPISPIPRSRMGR